MSSLKKLSRRTFLKIGIFSSGLTMLSVLSSCNQPVSTLQDKPTINSELTHIAKTSPTASSTGGVEIPPEYIYATNNNRFVLVSSKKNGNPALRMQKVSILKKENNLCVVSGIDKNASLLIHPDETIRRLDKIDKSALKKSFIAGKK